MIIGSNLKRKFIEFFQEIRIKLLHNNDDFDVFFSSEDKRVRKVLRKRLEREEKKGGGRSTRLVILNQVYHVLSSLIDDDGKAYSAEV